MFRSTLTRATSYQRQRATVSDSAALAASEQGRWCIVIFYGEPGAYRRYKVKSALTPVEDCDCVSHLVTSIYPL